MDRVRSELMKKGMAGRAASVSLARLHTDEKNRALIEIAESIRAHQSDILEANATDLRTAKQYGVSESDMDRLLLNPSRLDGIIRDVLSIAALPDPIGETFDQRTLENGLNIGKRRVPLGVIGAIYESRPNITIDISSLCIKSGNAVILRGGSEAINSNIILAQMVRESLSKTRIPTDAVQIVESTEREVVDHLLSMNEYVDLMIPRGGADFIRYVGENARMPVVTGGIGVCHTYVHHDADLDKAAAIAYNAKVQRPTVCNALDTLLVHSDIASQYLPCIAAQWFSAGVEMRCDERAFTILGENYGSNVRAATEGDWGIEFLSLVASVKVVDSFDDAIEHIGKYGSGHSEAIITEGYSSAMRFLDEVDAAAVFVNASTRFTDGGQFGLGAEVAISTNKLHARGPMGLRELTSYKWIIFGSGQVRI